MGDTSFRFKLFLAYGAVSILWGSTFLAIRYAIDTIPPLLMAGSRNLLAGIPLLVWALLKEKTRPSLADWARNGVIGAFLFVGGHGTLAWAELHVPTGLAALILTTMPLWMAMLDALRPAGSPLTPRIVIGLVIGFLGVALLIGPGDFLGGEPVHAVGALVLLGGALSWSIGSVYGRSTRGRSTPVQETMMRLLTGGSLLILGSFLAGEGQRVELAAVSMRSLLALGYLVVFGSIVTFTAFTWLLSHMNPARLGTYAYVNPVVALLLGWGIGAEAMNLRILATALLVLWSVALVLRKPKSDRIAVSPTVAAGAAGCPPRIALKEDLT
jgi:drug/metabolite transporter (DMT)-like permease